ncbi:MAG: lysine--tRNA ligase [Mesoaciditoga sp.]|uniref:lysine--tRNA ligase n=1 Tax=Athalassotoga sp. TaxID=2022597 RepID=UPI000CB667C1|nr:MAG: lysine--tRNA ligase [Mesoaciditoga sp.]PMP80343.1 MAG: lysine--tRNA ligase [Mesoaciditoga sp.]
MDEIRANKIKEIEEIRKLGVNPYPYAFDVKDKISQIRERFNNLTNGQKDESVSLSLAGRVMAIRYQGKSIFFVIQDSTGQIQGYLNVSIGSDKFEFFKDHVKVGDFVGVKGFPFRSHTGELTVFAADYQLLSKAIRTLPEKWHGLTDKEKIYRQRYVDMTVNRESFNRFKARYEIIKMIREFMNGEGFIEVETPILQFVTGGATARPFITHLNALDIDMYLKIAHELYLKRYIVGGFDAVYEIGKCFRNEGIDYKHNPEFTMIECYRAYVDYNYMMDLTERLVSYIIEKVNGTTKIEYQGKAVDFSRPWKRVKMRDYIKDHLGVDILEDPDEKMVKILKDHDALPEIMERGHYIEKLWDLVEDTITNPTFLLEHPVEISPLAKRHREDPRVTERFEVIVLGNELANAFSELNDPVDQRERFEAQAALRNSGDKEAQMMDFDFLRAIEYGMPPTGGLGIGIDRLVMFATNAATIKDVIAFPLIKPENFDKSGMEIEE